MSDDMYAEIAARMPDMPTMQLDPSGQFVITIGEGETQNRITLDRGIHGCRVPAWEALSKAPDDIRWLLVRVAELQAQNEALQRTCEAQSRRAGAAEAREREYLELLVAIRGHLLDGAPQDLHDEWLPQVVGRADCIPGLAEALAAATKRMAAILTAAQAAYVELEGYYTNPGVGAMDYYWRRVAEALYPSPAASVRADALDELIRAVGFLLGATKAKDGGRQLSVMLTNLAHAYRTYHNREDTPL